MHRLDRRALWASMLPVLALLVFLAGAIVYCEFRPFTAWCQ